MSLFTCNGKLQRKLTKREFEYKNADSYEKKVSKNEPRNLENGFEVGMKDNIISMMVLYVLMKCNA